MTDRHNRSYGEVLTYIRSDLIPEAKLLFSYSNKVVETHPSPKKNEQKSSLTSVIHQDAIRIISKPY